MPMPMLIWMLCGLLAVWLFNLLLPTFFGHISAFFQFRMIVALSFLIVLACMVCGPIALIVTGAMYLNERSL